MSKPIVIAVDYGHGGLKEDGTPVDTSKQFHFDGGLSVIEGVVNREVCWRLIRLLLTLRPDLDVRVFDVVARKEWTKDDLPSSASDLEQINVPLWDRVGYANGLDPQPGVFFSEHSNAMTTEWKGPGQTGAKGCAWFTSPGQTESDAIAAHIHRHFDGWDGFGLYVRKGELEDNDPDIERHFYVLTKTHCPAVLSEMGFYDNPHDAEYLLSAGGWSEMALGHAEALLSYFVPR